MSAPLKLDQLTPFQKKLLNECKITQAELSDRATNTFINRVITMFLNSNSASDISDLSNDLYPNLVTMLSNGMMKHRRGKPMSASPVIDPPNAEEIEKIVQEKKRIEDEKNKEPEHRENLKRQRDELNKKLEEVSEKKIKQLEAEGAIARDKEVLGLIVGSDGIDIQEDEEDGFINITNKKIRDWESLNESDVLAETRTLCKDLMKQLKLSNLTIAACLIRHYKWNKKDLLYDWTVKGPKYTSTKAGVSLTSSSLESDINSTEEQECLVCMDIFKPEDSFALPCGHRYCAICWKEYLDVSIDSGPGCVNTHCMSPDCQFIVHEEAFFKCASPEKYKRYAKILARSFVDNNNACKWCPSPACENCVIYKQNIPGDLNEQKGKKVGGGMVVVPSVECKCGFRFCWKCGDYALGDHAPARCEWIEEWEQKQASENENVTWLMENTKKCPKCQSHIEKNGGCMHMTCQRHAGGCGWEFCWLCRGPWSQHGGHTGGYYACNKYAADKQKYDAIDKKDTALAAKYMFYFHRYDSHKEALKIADGQVKGAEERGKSLTIKFGESTSTKFLKEAARQIFNNRRALQWSYVFGYFLNTDSKTSEAEKKKEQNLFEYLQEDLEKFTNYLSELYERPFAWEPLPFGTTNTLSTIETQKDVQAWEQDMTNYTKMCAKFLDNFNDGITKGLTKV